MDKDFKYEHSFFHVAMKNCLWRCHSGLHLGLILMTVYRTYVSSSHFYVCDAGIGFLDSCGLKLKLTFIDENVIALYGMFLVRDARK